MFEELKNIVSKIQKLQILNKLALYEVCPRGLSSERKKRIHEMAEDLRRSGKGISYPNGEPTLLDD